VHLVLNERNNMKKQNSTKPQIDFSNLRHQAEELLPEKELPKIPVNSIEDAQRLITELQVHQIELELQNDELRKMQEQLVGEREKYADLYNFAPVAYFTFDERDIIIDLNMSAAELLKNERKYLLGHPLTPSLSFDSLQTFIRHRQAALETKLPQVCELTIRPRNGETVYVQARTVALETKFDSPQIWRSVMTDITDRKHQEEKVNRQAYLLDNVSDAIIATDANLYITQWNKAAERVYGWSEAEVLGKLIDDVCNTEFLTVTQEVARSHLLSQKFWRGEVRQQKRDGKKLWVISSVSILEDALGRYAGGVTINHDITDRKRMERELQQSHAQLQATLDALPDLVFEVDRDGRILDFHASRLKELYAPPETFMGKTFAQVLPADAAQVIHSALTKATEQGTSFGAIYSLNISNRNNWYELSIAAMDSRQSNDARFIILAHDITERKKIEDELKRANDNLQAHIIEIESLQAKLREQAVRDPLTGLFNRRYLKETLDREISRAQREKKTIGFIIMDLDHFKQVNDTYGHKAGDMVLQKLGGLIIRNLRVEDIPCRYGGEEFTIMMPGASLEKTVERANFLLHEINEMAIRYDNANIKVAVSMGVSVFPDHGAGEEDALIRADRALYRAKELGRNQVVVYQDNNNQQIKNP